MKTQKRKGFNMNANFHSVNQMLLETSRACISFAEILRINIAKNKNSIDESQESPMGRCHLFLLDTIDWIKYGDKHGIPEMTKTLLNYYLKDFEYIQNRIVTCSRFSDFYKDFSFLSVSLASIGINLMACEKTLNAGNEVIFECSVSDMLNSVKSVSNILKKESYYAEHKSIVMQYKNGVVACHSKNDIQRKNSRIENITFNYQSDVNIEIKTMLTADILYGSSFEPGLLNILDGDSLLRFYMAENLYDVVLFYQDGMAIIKGHNTDVFNLQEVGDNRQLIGTYQRNDFKDTDIKAYLKLLSDIGGRERLFSNYVRFWNEDGHLNISATDGYQLIHFDVPDMVFSDGFNEILFIPSESLYKSISLLDMKKPFHIYYEFDAKKEIVKLWFEQSGENHQIEYRQEKFKWTPLDEEPFAVTDFNIKDVKHLENLKPLIKGRDSKSINITLSAQNSGRALSFSDIKADNYNTEEMVQSSVEYIKSLRFLCDETISIVSEQKTIIDIDVDNLNSIIAALKKLSKTETNTRIGICFPEETRHNPNSRSLYLRIDTNHMTMFVVTGIVNSFAYNRGLYYVKMRNFYANYQKILKEIGNFDDNLFKYTIHDGYHPEDMYYSTSGETSGGIPYEWIKSLETNFKTLKEWTDLNKNLWEFLLENPYYHSYEATHFNKIDIFNQNMHIFDYEMPDLRYISSYHKEKIAWVDAYTYREAIEMGFWYVKALREEYLAYEEKRDKEERTFDLPKKYMRYDTWEFLQKKITITPFVCEKFSDSYRFYFPKPYKVLTYANTTPEEREQYMISDLNTQQRVLIDDRGCVLMKYTYDRKKPTVKFYEY